VLCKTPGNENRTGMTGGFYIRPGNNVESSIQNKKTPGGIVHPGYGAKVKTEDAQ